MVNIIYTKHFSQLIIIHNVSCIYNEVGRFCIFQHIIPAVILTLVLDRDYQHWFFNHFAVITFPLGLTPTRTHIPRLPV